MRERGFEAVHLTLEAANLLADRAFGSFQRHIASFVESREGNTSS